MESGALKGELHKILPVVDTRGSDSSMLDNTLEFLVMSDPLRRTFTTFAPSGKPLQQFVYTEQLDTPTGIATLALGDQLFIAASDTRACTVSLWRMAVSQLR